MIDLIVSLVVLGLALWLIDRLPIDGQIKRVIHIIAIVVALLWVLSWLGGYRSAIGGHW